MKIMSSNYSNMPKSFPVVVLKLYAISAWPCLFLGVGAERMGTVDT